MNFNWNYQNIISSIKALNSRYKVVNNNYVKSLIAADLKQYLKLLSMMDNIDFNLKDQIKNNYCVDICENITRKHCNDYNILFCNSSSKFFQLIDDIYNLDVNTLCIDEKQDYLIDTVLIEHIKNFTKNFDINLYNHFIYLYEHNYINFNKSHEPKNLGRCFVFNTSYECYIELFINSGTLIVPTLMHEIGHSYDRIFKPEVAYLKTIFSMYSEVYAQILELLFIEYLQSTNYYKIGNIAFLDWIYLYQKAAVYVKENFDKEDPNVVQKWDAFYGSNIALAFLEQYKINEKEAKENLHFFLRHNNIVFSDELLSELGIDLKKLYNGTYFIQNYNRGISLSKSLN